MANCLTATTIYPNFDHKGMKWANDASGQGGAYSHVMMPNTKACDFTGNGWAAAQTLVGASSYHSGGVNGMLGDGSVRFLKDSIDLKTWKALSSRSGGEVISAEGY